MVAKTKVKKVGILTAGGDSPGLNAAIRGFGKTAIGHYGMELIGFRDGVTGLVEDRWETLDGKALSGILTVGGTILGTSRDKVHKYVVDGEVQDMVPTVVENYQREGLDALIMLGGGGTAKNAMKLVDAGLNVLHLPKTIDNDIARTDTSFGFATAMEIATDAIDRVHSTAHSHHRIILTEIMGHRAGWLTLGAGLAGGADIILIPEIPYTVESVASTIKARTARGSTFSVVAVDKKPTKRNPYPPFTTSSLQQDASSRLGFSPSRTMQIAQRLYEDGIITYMRTDAVQMAPEGIDQARRAIVKEFGSDYVPEKARIYQTKAKNAQEAHEAIRPTDMFRHPDTLRGDPRLGPLLRNSGPTRTHALLPDSPVLDAGANVDGLAYDQRGFPHVRVFGAAPDIGAFEQGALPPAPAPVPLSRPLLFALATLLLLAASRACRSIRSSRAPSPQPCG